MSKEVEKLEAQLQRTKARLEAARARAQAAERRADVRRRAALGAAVLRLVDERGDAARQVMAELDGMLQHKGERELLADVLALARTDDGSELPEDDGFLPLDEL